MTGSGVNLCEKSYISHKIFTESLFDLYLNPWGILPQIFGGGVQRVSWWNPYPFKPNYVTFDPPYFRPLKFAHGFKWPQRMASICVNIGKGLQIPSEGVLPYKNDQGAHRKCWKGSLEGNTMWTWLKFVFTLTGNIELTCNFLCRGGSVPYSNGGHYKCLRPRR